MTDLSLEQYRKRSQKSLISEQDRSSSLRIFYAVNEQLLEGGFDSLSLQKLAKHLGVSRTTIYRRWSSVSELVLDAIAETVQQSIDLSDSVSSDSQTDPQAVFKKMLQQLTEFLQSPYGKAYLQASLSIEDADMQKRRAALWQDRYAQIYAVFAGLDSTQKLPKTVLDNIISMVLGGFYFQIFIQQQPITQAYIEMSVQQTVMLIEQAQHAVKAP